MNPYIIIAVLLALGVTASGGFLAGKEWEQGRQAQEDIAAEQARQSDQKQQRQFNDRLAARHASQLATLSKQLGDAREHIASLSGRVCLDPRTVGVLDTIGATADRADAGQPSGAPEAPAANPGDGTGLRYSTDRDIAGWIATCRARYAEVASQLNKYLDREDKLFPPEK